MVGEGIAYRSILIHPLPMGWEDSMQRALCSIALDTVSLLINSSWLAPEEWREEKISMLLTTAVLAFTAFA